MNAVRLPRLFSAAALLAFAGACADQPMPLAPSTLGLSANRLSGTVAGEGELQLCKTGNAAGTFQFDYSVVDRDTGLPVTSGTASVDVGQCTTILQLPTTGTTRLIASITETTLPANWSLNSITAVNTTATPPGWTPKVDLGTKTVSNIGVANDVGATVTFDNQYTPPPPPPPGCTYTLGYWKTHSKAGPAPYDPTWAMLPGGLEQNTIFFLSGKTWLAVFNTAPAGNAYYQLSQQYMAAKLNVLGGADPTAAAAAIAAAETLFNTYTPAQVAALPKNSAVRAQFIALSGTLDQYNNGIIGPGHC